VGQDLPLPLARAGPAHPGPDKPIAQYADVWAAVMYGYASQQMTAHVMVGLSQIAECYINFGFIGALLALTLIGMLYRCVDEILAHPRAGPGPWHSTSTTCRASCWAQRAPSPSSGGRGAGTGLLCPLPRGPKVAGFSRPHVRLWATGQ